MNRAVIPLRFRVDRILAAPERGGKIDVLDPTLIALLPTRKYDGAFRHGDPLDHDAHRPRSRFAARLCRRTQACEIDAFALQRKAQHRAANGDLGDLRPAGEHARQRERNPDALRTEATIRFAVPIDTDVAR